MKFPYYGLIISLSLALCSSQVLSKEKAINAKDAAPAAVAVSETSDVNSSEEWARSLKQTSDQLTKQIYSFYYQALISTTSMNEQITEIKNKQSEIMFTLETIKTHYEASQSTVTSPEIQIAALKKMQEDTMAMLLKLNENQEQLRDKLANLQGNLARISQTKGAVITSTDSKKSPLVPTRASIEQMSGQQYVKLKLLEDGQEVEIFLDPTYVDMNLALPKNKKTDKQDNLSGSKKDSDNIDKIMQYITENIKKPGSAQQVSSSGAQQPDPSANNTYNMPSTQNAQKQSNPSAIEENKTYPVENPVLEDSQTLDDLLKAQKYFYEKKYNAALNSVQRSLAKQETALAHAIEGSIYFTMGEVDLAVSSWEAALRLNPNMIEVRKALFKFKR